MQRTKHRTWKTWLLVEEKDFQETGKGTQEQGEKGQGTAEDSVDAAKR